MIYRVSRSWFGNVLWSIREGDLLASSIGINVPGSKLVAFIVSAFFAGLAGSLYATYFGYISPLVFTFEYSVNVLVYIVVGGFAIVRRPHPRRRRVDAGAGTVSGHRQIPEYAFRPDPGRLDAD